MLPFLLAAAGGYLIGSSLKSKQYADGGGIKSGTKFTIEKDEDRTKISIKGVGSVILVETYPEYEFMDDVDEDIIDELGVEEGELIGKIEHLEVKNEYKGKGYAKLLMNKAIELAKKKNLFPLYLNASPMGYGGLSLNDLTAFYEKFGFKVFLHQGGNNLMILKEKMADGGITQSDKLSLDEKMNFITAYNYAKDRDVFYKGTFAEFKESFSKKAPKSAKYSQKVMNATYNALQQDNSIMAHGGDIRKIKGNNFSQQIENGQRFKALIQKVFDDQKGDRIYPLEYIKATALTPHPIVKIDGKNYISGDAYKGTYSHFEFMDDPNFIKALEYVDRPKIRAKR